MFDMRLLIIHPHLDFVGGSENLTRILIYELKDICEVIVVTRAKKPEFFPEESNVRFRYIRETGFEGYGPLTTKIMNLLTTYDEVLHRDKPDAALIMIQEPIHALLLKTIRPGFKVGIYIHYPFEEELTEENLRLFINMYRFPNIYNEYYKYTDVRFVNSHYTLKALYGYYEIDASVVYPAICWKYFEEEIDVREKRGNVIISIGRFIPHKRLDYLIKLFKYEIKPEIPDAELYIIGIPDARYKGYYNTLKELAENTKDVHLIADSLSEEEMIKYYRLAKVYVHLRIGEHFGMAPVEAMSQGTIPIIPKDSGLAELVTHEKDGYTFTTDDELVKYIKHVLKLDEETLAKMRRRAIKTSYYFTPSRFAKEIFHYLETITKKG